MCGVCACGVSLMCLRVIIVLYCVMVHGLCVFCVFVWVFRLMCLCVVYVDYCLMLFGLLLCVIVLRALFCLTCGCDLFLNMLSDAAWPACLYY